MASRTSVQTAAIDTSAKGEHSVDELKRENAAMRAELTALRASTSWRITEPLRRIVSVARRRPLPEYVPALPPQPRLSQER